MSNRVYWVDWIRIFATYMVLLHHNSILFDYDIAHIVIARSKLFTRLLRFLDLWGMQIFCFIAGYTFSLQLKKDDETTCIKLFISKFKRLIIPIYVSSIVFVSTADFINLFYQRKVTLGDFPLYFAEAIVLKKFRISHLWFLVVIFAFMMINFPLFSWIKNRKMSQVKIGFILSFLTVSCIVFKYFDLPFAYYYGIVGSYLPILLFLTSLESNGILINFWMITHQILTNMLMNPLPSQVKTSEPGHALLILLSLNIFFQSGYYMHHFIEKMSFLEKYVEYVFLLSTPFIIYLTPQQETGYIYDDKNYIDLTERFLFHLGSWYWILFTCWSCYQKLNFQTFGYRFLGATAFSVYLSHMTFLYLFGAICATYHLNDVVSFFLVNGCTLICSYLFYLVSMSNRITMFLFYGEVYRSGREEQGALLTQ